MRYCVCDVFAKTPEGRGSSYRIPVLASCFGGIFKVWSTKTFPGLSGSTTLTKVGIFPLRRPYLRVFTAELAPVAIGCARQRAFRRPQDWEGAKEEEDDPLRVVCRGHAEPSEPVWGFRDCVCARRARQPVPRYGMVPDGLPVASAPGCRAVWEQ